MNQFCMYCLTLTSEVNRLPLRDFFKGIRNGIIAGREIWTVWRVTENLPLEFLQEYRDCVGCMRPCIVMEQNDPTGELAWLFRFDGLMKGGQDLRVMLGIHCCPMLQEVLSEGGLLGQRRMSA